FASRTRLEAFQAVGDSMFDSSVVADLEVQKPDLAEAAPVPPIQHPGLFQTDRARYDLAPIPSCDKPQVSLKVSPKQAEEFLCQVLASPVQLFDGRQVHLELALNHAPGSPPPRQYPHVDARLPNLAALVAHRGPPLVLQAPQVVVESRKSGILPMILIAVAHQESG